MGALFQTQIRRIIAFSGMVNISYIVWTMIDFQLDHMNVTTTLNNYVTFIALIVIYGITILSLSGSLITWQYIYGQNELIEIKNVHQLSGLWHINKTLCIYFLISIFSLTGVPPLFGFYTKFYLAAILLNHVAFEQGIVVLSWSCVSVLYYLGIIKILFFDKVYKGLFLKKQPIILYLIISTLCIIQLFFFIKPLILYILF
jgi:NADH-quinone oxidoreductase subunit N